MYFISRTNNPRPNFFKLRQLVIHDRLTLRWLFERPKTVWPNLTRCRLFNAKCNKQFSQFGRNIFPHFISSWIPVFQPSRCFVSIFGLDRSTLTWATVFASTLASQHDQFKLFYICYHWTGFVWKQTNLIVHCKVKLVLNWLVTTYHPSCYLPCEG